MTDIEKLRVNKVILEAIKIYRDYPTMTIYEAIDKAKEVNKDA